MPQPRLVIIEILLLDIAVHAASQIADLVRRHFEPARDLGHLELPGLKELRILGGHAVVRLKRDPFLDQQELVRPLDALVSRLDAPPEVLARRVRLECVWMLEDAAERRTVAEERTAEALRREAQTD